MVTVKCSYCKKGTNVYPYQLKKYKNVFCNNKCKGHYSYERSFNNKIHNLSNTRFYGIWFSIKTRCFNLKATYYNRYGGRGIKVCDKWLKFESFRDDMYKSYLKHCEDYSIKQTTIDRIDNDGNYEPDNCRWATQKEQANNTVQTNFITFNNQTLPLQQLSKMFKIPHGTLWHRLYRSKWSIEKALHTPIIKQYTHNGYNLSISEWSKKLNIDYPTLYMRIKKWPLHIALNSKKYINQFDSPNNNKRKNI